MYNTIYSNHNAAVGSFLEWTSKMLILSLTLFSFGNGLAQKKMLDNKMHHLRNGGTPEWSEFKTKPEGSHFILHFFANINISEQTLSLKQYEVNQAWQVKLNDRRLGELALNEKYAISYFTIMPGTLRHGENILTIEPTEPAATVSRTDDISIGDIILEERELKELFSEASIDVEVRDHGSEQPIPSRITITGKDGALQPTDAVSNEHLAVRTGCIYTGNGKAHFGLPAGNYTIYAGRGFEYGIDSVQITLRPGDSVFKKFIIEKEVPTDGWISSDTHIHSLTYSGHGDATIEERALTIAGEGIELPVITEHNVNVDIDTVAGKVGVRPNFTPVTGDEITTVIGHFNVFPVPPGTAPPDPKIKDWDELTKNINEAPGTKAIILNHARDIHNNFRPFGSEQHIAIAGMSMTGWTFPANAMEVMNSGSQQTDIMRLYNDWFGMLNRGYRLTPVGSSDSHDVSRYIVGQGRTYIRNEDTNTRNINVTEALRNLLEGKVMVSCGLLAEMTIDSVYGPGDIVPAADNVLVSVRVLGPAWIQADHIGLYANGQKIKEAVITNGKAAGIKWQGSWLLPGLKHDVFLVAIAEGPGNYMPFWPIAKPYQHDSPEWDPHVIGSSGAIWIDADDNGHFTSAYEYAQELIKASHGNMDTLINKLSFFDKAVAIQAASLLYESGVDLTTRDVVLHLANAGASTKAGFRSFINALKKLKQ